LIKENNIMKKIVMTVLILLITGCFWNREDTIHLSCDGDIDRMELFYTSETHVYYFLTRPNYVEYNGEQISFSEALERNIITLEDISKSCEIERLPHVEEN